MATMQDVLAKKIVSWRKEIASIRKQSGEKVISQVTVDQAYGGMRGVNGLVCDTSVVEPDKGLIIRGYPLLEIKDLWPEDVFYLLLTGDRPDAQARESLRREYDKRAQVPDYVWSVLLAMPVDSHPMCMLNTAILCMERESRFRAAYDRGMPKEEYWIPMLEDSLTLLARLPGIAAGIYRMRYSKGDRIPWAHELDWGANYARMLGLADPQGSLVKLMRLYLTFHSDHEGGNVSAFSCHTIGSALSDAYYAVSGGLNGLAGPLHGLANQECLNWVLEVMKKFIGIPSETVLRDFAFETLRQGKVIPGYGHAVLRVVDPRFSGLLEFGQQYMRDDPVFQTVERVFNVVPRVLQEYSDERVKAGKAPIANCWPNVDACSGALFYHYGLTEFPYYTVLFAVARAMGMLAQLTLNRAMGTAITRPKSVSTEWIRANACKA